jgi:hypothetical protein
MSAMYQLVMQQTLAYINKNFSYIVQRIAFWVYNFSYYLGLCTEEICLGMLVRDFRKFLKEQLRTIFPCFGKSEPGNNVGTTGATTAAAQQQKQQQLQQQRPSVVVVKSNIVRVTNALSAR